MTRWRPSDCGFSMFVRLLFALGVFRLDQAIVECDGLIGNRFPAEDFLDTLAAGGAELAAFFRVFQ